MGDFAKSLYILILFGFIASSTAQTFDTETPPLPPEIMSDRYLVKVELLEAQKDYAAAFNVMEKVIALHKTHDLKLPVDFRFKYARVALAADSIRIAYDSVNMYLTTAGREGEFYKQALLLSLEAEEELEDVVIPPEETCAEKTDKYDCWASLADRPKCYVWNYTSINNQPAEMEWSGRCAGNVGRGKGTLTCAFGGSLKYTAIGTLRKGKFHGKYVETSSFGPVTEGVYANGIRHGLWIERYYSNLRERGEYINGKRVGSWLRYTNQGWEGSEEYCTLVTYRGGQEATSRNVMMSKCEGW